LVVVDELKRLRQDEAIERIGWKAVEARKIGHDGRTCITGVNVDDVASLDSRAESFCVPVVPDFKHSSGDIAGILAQELLDVKPIDRQSAIEPPNGAEWRGAAQSTQPRRAPNSPQRLG
jgi:hypothetical protein